MRLAAVIMQILSFFESLVDEQGGDVWRKLCRLLLDPLVWCGGALGMSHLAS